MGAGLAAFYDNYNIRIMKTMDAIELASIINKPSALFLFMWSIVTKQCH
jgi:hypothetical protein